jgi:hypothetical protein
MDKKPKLSSDPLEMVKMVDQEMKRKRDRLG